MGENPSSHKRVEEQRKKDFGNVEEAWTKLRLLGYSGTLSVGVDFSVEHFDRVIGIYSGNIGLSADILV